MGTWFIFHFYEVNCPWKAKCFDKAVIFEDNLYDKEKIIPKNHHITSFRGHVHSTKSFLHITYHTDKKTVKRKLPY